MTVARYAGALRATAARGAVPYGYTLTLWSSGALQVVAAGVAFGAVDLVARAGETAAWPLGAFTATVIYLGLTALELALVHRPQT
jgi:hypothetical protein